MLTGNDLTNQKGYINGTNRDIINGNTMVVFYSNNMGYGKEIAMKWRISRGITSNSWILGYLIFLRQSQSARQRAEAIPPWELFLKFLRIPSENELLMIPKASTEWCLFNYSMNVRNGIPILRSHEITGCWFQLL